MHTVYDKDNPISVKEHDIYYACVRAVSGNGLCQYAICMECYDKHKPRRNRGHQKIQCTSNSKKHNQCYQIIWSWGHERSVVVQKRNMSHCYLGRSSFRLHKLWEGILKSRREGLRVFVQIKRSDFVCMGKNHGCFFVHVVCFHFLRCVPSCYN